MPGVNGSSDQGTRERAVSDVLATLAIVAVVIGAALAPRVYRRLAAHPSQTECAALLDHYVELVARAAQPEPAASAIAERRAAARAASATQGFSRCEDDLTRDEVTCALGAGNADDLERCLP